ncbi:MAG: hypothetical protein PVF36_04535, partial [Desulfobacterales bacterium]
YYFRDKSFINLERYLWLPQPRIQVNDTFNYLRVGELFQLNSSMNNQRLHHTNSYIRGRKERTENSSE